jgi:beta-mannanase
MQSKVISKILITTFIGLLLVNTSYAQTSHKVLNYLYSISGKQTIAGQESMQYRDSMYAITGHYAALWGEDFSFSYWQNTTSMAQWRSLLVTKAKQVWANGDIVGLMFHACPPTGSEPCNWDGGPISSLTDAQWTELITDGTTLNKNWKTRLDAIVPYLLQLQNAGVEVLFRPLHEMNQGAFWWGGRSGSNGSARLYQITHDYLVKTKGLTNLIFVWNLQDFSTLSSDVNTYDPGSGYWDVLALDVYWSDGQGFTTAKYNTIVKKAAGKPIAIGECGTLPGVSILKAQPLWTYFMGWSELTQEDNSDYTISSLYKAANVITEDEMPGWKDSLSVDTTIAEVPANFQLYQNHPNPFNPATKIEFDILQECFVTLKVYNSIGREVKTLVNEEKSPNHYEVNFYGSGLPSGVYLYRLKAGNFVQTKQMVFLK